jgi:hypothetical protein
MSPTLDGANSTTENLLQIGSSQFWNLIQDRHGKNGGVYKVIAMKDGRRIPISRLLGKDDEGILYIGKASSFIDRVIELKKSIDPNYSSGGHDCGVRYKKNPNIAMKFPYEVLHVELVQSQDPGALESMYLKEYQSKFGEVPPLNAVSS